MCEKSQDSNPGRLGEKRKRYLCAMPLTLREISNDKYLVQQRREPTTTIFHLSRHLEPPGTKTNDSVFVDKSVWFNLYDYGHDELRAPMAQIHAAYYTELEVSTSS